MIIIPKELKLPSVSKVLNFNRDTSFLDAWKERIGEEAANLISLNSRNRGSVMHKLVENFLKESNSNITDIINNSTFEDIKDLSKDNIKTGIFLFKNIIESNILKDYSSVIVIEYPLYYYDEIKKIGYQGRLDIIYKKINNLYVILDLKTSNKMKNKEWITDYLKQSSAYAFAYYQRFNIFPIVQISIALETGGVQEFIIEKSEVKYYFDLFLKDLNNYYEDLNK